MLSPRLDESWNYVRMSTEKGQEDSPLTQSQHTEELITRDGLPPWTRSYYDLGESAKSTDKRPGILAMLADAERLRPACIVFYKLDRAFRNSYEQGIALRRLKKLAIRVIKVRDPNIEGPQGDMVDTILGAVNQFERELIGVRIKDHNQAMAQRGEWAGGPAPFGYQHRKPVRDPHNSKVILQTGGIEPHPVEWPIVRQLWDWALAGHRPAEILQLAFDAGHRRRNGQPLVYTMLYRLFDSKVYAGFVPFGHHPGGQSGGLKRQPGVGEWYQGKHAPVVTLDEWQKVQLLLHQGNEKQRSRRKPRMELAGLISCRLCGRPVASSGVNQSGFQYTCIAAARRDVNHPQFNRREWVFLMGLRQLLDHLVTLLPEAPPVTDSEAQRAHVERDIANLKGQRRRLRDLYQIGEYNDDLDAYQARKAKLETQIAAKEAELRNVGASSDQLRQLHQDLLGWHQAHESTSDIATRQRLWRLFVERVETDGQLMVAHLRDLGPGVPRTWQIDLPPKNTKQPGGRSGGGVTGKPKDGRPSLAFMASDRLKLQPLLEKA